MNVGIVGIRGFGGTYLKTIAARPNDRVVALCDLDADAVNALADTHGVPHRLTDFKDVLAVPGLDAVFVATPHFLHHGMVLSAIAAGKHVFCEKPLAITSIHADEMAAAARSKGVVLTCHYNQRVRPYVNALRKIVRDGRVGTPYQVNARWMARWTGFMFDAATSWRLQMAKSGGGILIGRGSHLIDAVLYMLDFPAVQTVYATTHNRLTGGEVDDFASVVLRLAGGVVVNVQCSYVAHASAFTDRMEYELYGSDGGAAYLPGKDGNNVLTLGRGALPSSDWTDASDEIRAAADTPRPATIIDDFLDAVAESREPLVTGEQAANVTRILEAAYASSAGGCVVELRP